MSKSENSAFSGGAKQNGMFQSALFKNVTTVFSGDLLTRAIGFITTWILVRHLTPDDYGIFSILDMVTGVSAGLITTGFNWSMIKSVASLADDSASAWHIAGTVLKIEIIYGLVLAAGLYFGARIVSNNLFHKPELIFYLRLSSIGVFGNILFNYRNSIFQAFLKFRLNAIFSASHALCYLGIILIFLMANQFNIRIISIVYVTLPVVISIAAIGLLKDGFKQARKERLSVFLSSMGPKYGWLLCYTLCLWFCGQFHMVILSRYYPMQEIGFYGFAYKIYGLSLMFMNAVNSVLLPTFSGITDKGLLRKAYKKTLKATAAVSVLFFLCIPFLGIFISIFAGNRYRGACTMLQILIFGTATSTVLSPAINVLFALEEYRLIALGGLIFTAINLIGQLLITPVYGGLGAASVQVASFLALCLWGAYFSFTYTKTSG